MPAKSSRRARRKTSMSGRAPSSLPVSSAPAILSKEGGSSEFNSPRPCGEWLSPGAETSPGADASIAVRQHVIRLWLTEPESMENVLAGVVARQVFLGPSRDYLVELSDRTPIRVVASAAENIAPGAAV